MSDTSHPLTFQIVCTEAKDIGRAYHIRLFGSTATGDSVCLDVTGFRPYFYVEIPTHWTPADRAGFKRYLYSTLRPDESGDVTITPLNSQVAWDFTNDEMFPFFRVETPSKRIWQALRDECLDPDTLIPKPSIIRGDAPRLFEANMDPMLSFFHVLEIPPAGWVTVAPDMWDYIEEKEEESSGSGRASEPVIVTIHATSDWDAVKPADAATQLTSAPLRVLSWDIECTSSHGDFPLASKNWRKPAREIVEARMTDWGTVRAAIVAAMSPMNTGPLSRVYVNPSLVSAALVTLDELEDKWPPVASAIAAGADNAVDLVSELLCPAPPPPPPKKFGSKTTKASASATKKTKATAEEPPKPSMPLPDGDPIIQIGCTLYVRGIPQRSDIFVLGSCTTVPGPNTYTHTCVNESQLIREWCKFLMQTDPDIMMGYNIFGFDMKYLWDRAVINRSEKHLSALGRTRNMCVRLEEKQLSSSAMGDNSMHIIKSVGRLHIDLLLYVRRNAVLDSYSLDNVTATFMSGSVARAPTASATDPTLWTIATKSTKGTVPGRYIVLMDEENDVIGDKLEVVSVEPKALHVRMVDGGEALRDHGPPPVRWSQSKDDVSPKEIFALHAGGAADRAKVAKYCIQDCVLVMELFQKLEVLNNSVAMANVCWVPLEFIFTRGQGIKSESLVFYECRKLGKLFPVLPAPPRRRDEAEALDDCAVAVVPEIINGDDNESYEGAIVLDPLSGIYLDDDPVAALDFSSLYPSSEISENLSWDSLVSVKDYNMSGRFLKLKEGSDRYDNLPGWDYLEVEYDILRPEPTDMRKHPALVPSGRRVCRYAQPRDGSKSTLPRILMKLLSQRKATRKAAEKETDDFRKALLDAQQLAYKLTANSLYGQLGSNTSKIRRKCLAASTTAHGRQQLLFSKACIERAYGPDAGDPRCSAIAVYGDTDSVFIAFRPRDPVTGERLTGYAAQAAAKALAEEAGHKISGALKSPHDFEFDKMFRCFCLLSKKRYVGDMTEGGLDDDDYHRKSMGIVMKRRDNAPIVKYVYGGVIERILVERSVRAAFEFTRQAALELLAGKFPMRRLTITKSLRAEYKSTPAHKVLADRIGKRDPGNKPASNDRIPFVYVLPAKGAPAPTSQGERIETPTYIREKGLKPDYAFYITNQIAKPVAQVFGLVVEQLPGVKRHQLDAASRATDPVAAREKLAEELLFGDLVRDAHREAAGIRDVRSFFTARQS